MQSATKSKTILPFLVFAVVSILAFLASRSSTENQPNKQALVRSEKEPKSMAQRYENVDARWRFEFEQLKDPRTGKIPRGIHQKELAQARTLPKRDEAGILQGLLIGNTYTGLGPNNLGGRTRAVAYDKLTPTIMLSGGISSGMFRTVNSGTTWTRVSPTGFIHSVTSVAQDPRSGFESTWYYGTGEASGNSTSASGATYFGHGIFKSANNGVTWSQLASTVSTLEGFDSEFDFVHRIVVDPTNGNVYAAGQRVFMRSTDGGTSWSAVLGELGGGTSTGQCDVVVDATGRFYAAFHGGAGTTTGAGLPPSTALDGVWTSTTGASGSWTKIAGAGSPAGWNATGTYGRVVLATLSGVLYALYDNGTVSNCAGTAAPEANFFKWTQATTTWENRSANLPDEPGCNNGNDPFAVQGGFDLVVAVKPDDVNFVVIGGTNAYRSTNGFATTGATTRIGGYATTADPAQYANHHSDIHAFTFHPSTSTTMVSGDDGGIHLTTDINAATVVWTSLNNDYVTYQYYHVALDPTAASMKAIGGLQDNGTAYTTGTTSHTPVYSGDGVAVGISAENTFHYLGSQQGDIQRRLPADPPHVATDIKPTGSGQGIFVTYFYLNPDNTEQLYYASDKNLYRTTSASTVAVGTWTLMTAFNTTLTGNISAMATSRGTYSATHKLYIGTDDGKIYRLDDPANAVAGTAPVNITGAAMPASANVSGIAVDPTDDNKIMVTFSNYSVLSIWYTADASAATPTWSSVEGNLNLPSVRTCVIVNRLGNPTEYYVGTSVGFYGTTALTAGTTSWTQEGSGTLGYSVVRTLAYRPFDNGLLLGTHGNGMFYATVPNPLPIQLASFTGRILTNGSVRLEWRTLSELNNYGFFVERKLQGEPVFVELPNVFISGHGTTNIPHDYAHTDVTASAGLWQYRLRQVDLDGTAHYTDAIAVSVTTGVDGSSLPIAYRLYQNYPNPFNPTTTIRYDLPSAGFVSLKVFDIRGSEVRTLVNEFQDVGFKSIRFDAASLASGIYIFRLQAGSFVQTKKLTLLR